MNEMDLATFEESLLAAARAFPYPPTPDLSRKPTHPQASAPLVKPRWRLGLALAVVVLLISVLMAVPPVRAQILEFLQMGAVRIFLTSPTETPPATLPAASTPAHTLTPAPSPTPLASVLDLAGQTTLEEAKARTEFPILLPAYPADLGAPDQVFLQDLDGDVLVMVWVEPDRPDRVRFSLHEFGPGTMTAEKWQPQAIEHTTVNGRPAFWTSGPYLVRIKRGDLDVRRLIDGHVLVWTDGEVTYRLETKGTLEEAVAIAESLQPMP